MKPSKRGTISSSWPFSSQLNRTLKAQKKKDLFGAREFALSRSSFPYPMPKILSATINWKARRLKVYPCENCRLWFCPIKLSSRGHSLGTTIPFCANQIRGHNNLFLHTGTDADPGGAKQNFPLWCPLTLFSRRGHVLLALCPLEASILFWHRRGPTAERKLPLSGMGAANSAYSRRPNPSTTGESPSWPGSFQRPGIRLLNGLIGHYIHQTLWLAQNPAET